MKFTAKLVINYLHKLFPLFTSYYKLLINVGVFKVFIWRLEVEIFEMFN